MYAERGGLLSLVDALCVAIIQPRLLLAVPNVIATQLVYGLRNSPCGTALKRQCVAYSNYWYIRQMLVDRSYLSVEVHCCRNPIDAGESRFIFSLQC